MRVHLPHYAWGISPRIKNKQITSTAVFPEGHGNVSLLVLKFELEREGVILVPSAKLANHLYVMMKADDEGMVHKIGIKRS